MFQNNPLLEKLKKRLQKKVPRVEGVVKSTKKGFGFLEIDTQNSFFIPPCNMKQVMHGDRIIAKLQVENNREIVQPEKLLESFLNIFVGIVKKVNDKIFILPDHPLLNEWILCDVKLNNDYIFETDDWVVAKLTKHKLRGEKQFYATIIQFIIKGTDPFTPWYVTLARHNLECKPPNIDVTEIDLLDQSLDRKDLTELDFITIDSINTKDIDDAIFIETQDNKTIHLIIAIADPTAYIFQNSDLDKLALQRSFTNYLPGFNVPMLPRILSENICSLHPSKKRAVLACSVLINKDGNILDGSINFFSAWIISKEQLIYENVSEWLENTGIWKPQSNKIANQISLLYNFYIIRSNWRRKNTVIFKDRSEYQFHITEDGDVLDVSVASRRVAHKMIEEAMIVANICAAKILTNKLGFGIYNIHTGFDKINAEHATTLLKNYNIHIDSKELTTLSGFCKLYKKLDVASNNYLNIRIRRLQSFVEISTTPGPHFALGFKSYATWTSPIRKYGDMINHRLLKSIIYKIKAVKPHFNITKIISDNRRRNRIAERDVEDWLYTLFLKKKKNDQNIFDAEIIDIFRGGMKVKLIKNGAIVFIPAPFLHIKKDELICDQEMGIVFIMGKIYYRLSDVIKVKLVDIRIETRSIIATPIVH